MDYHDRWMIACDRAGLVVMWALGAFIVAGGVLTARGCIRDDARPTAAYEARARDYAQRMFGDETPLVDCTHRQGSGWRRCDVVTRGRILMLLCDGEGCSLRDRGTDTVVVPVVTTPP